MKNILIPTDFSAHSEKALIYGLRLAKQINARVKLLHIYKTPSTNTNTVLFEQELKRRQEALMQASLLVSQDKNLWYETMLLQGEPSEAIISAARKENSALIIMGTTGLNQGNRFLGSVASNVMSLSPCPVLAIPASCEYSDFRHIVFATAWEMHEMDALLQVIRLAEATYANITLVHAGDTLSNETSEKEELFKSELRFKSNYDKIQYVNIRTEDVAAGIQFYITDEKCDLLVMCTHYRSVRDSIFGKSLTKHLALNAQGPIMAFHYWIQNTVKAF